MVQSKDKKIQKKEKSLNASIKEPRNIYFKKGSTRPNPILFIYCFFLKKVQHQPKNP